jgi:hypothetical protein
MQTWSSDGVRQERTGWRDEAISSRHRVWGFNCPAVDLDFLVVEYNVGKPVALIEYKHHAAAMPYLQHPTYRALTDLAENYGPGQLPFAVVFYWPDIWAFRVLPVNDAAKSYFTKEMYCERDYVKVLYYMRRILLTHEVKGKLSTGLPQVPDFVEAEDIDF